jgi:hypothetical protein
MTDGDSSIQITDELMETVVSSPQKNAYRVYFTQGCTMDGILPFLCLRFVKT